MIAPDLLLHALLRLTSSQAPPKVSLKMQAPVEVDHSQTLELQHHLCELLIDHLMQHFIIVRMS